MGSMRSRSDKDSDKRVGRALRELRGSMSQQAIAERMRDAGWPWVQRTVSAAEVGERSLRLVEAKDLAEVLGVPMEALTGTIDEDTRRTLADVRETCTEIRERERRLVESSRELDELQLKLVEAVSALPEAARFELDEAHACSQLDPSAIVERTRR